MKHIRYRIVRIRFLLSVLSFTSICHHHAIANAFSLQDFAVVNELDKRSLALGEDIVATLKAMAYQPGPSSLCLVEMRGELDNIHAIISEMATLVSLSNSMLYPADEAIVNLQMKNNAKFGLRSLGSLRGLVNTSAAYCATIAIITTKGESILNLITATENVFRQIANRVSNL
jgi:hypothetical protein